MKHARLQILTADLPAASLLLAELGVFNPDTRSDPDRLLTDIPGHRYRELHQQASTRLQKITTSSGYQPALQDQTHKPISEQTLMETNHWLGEAWQHCSDHEEAQRSHLDELHEIEQLENTLSNFRHLKIDLGRLQSHKRFLDIHIGSVPQEHLVQLRDAVSLDGYLLIEYLEKSPNTHVIIFGPGAGRSPHLKSVLDTAGFRAFELPEALHTEPRKAALSLQERRNQTHQRLTLLHRDFTDWLESVKPKLRESATILQLAGPFVQLGEAARHRGSLAQLRGWVPSADILRLTQALENRLANPFVLQTRDPTEDERPLVPSVMRHNKFLQPFSILVSQYGVPRYGEFNPTSLFAITFVCMFGMMFGDVGHGAVFFIAALLARRRLGTFTYFAMAAGISSVIFGFLYGSLFGYEHILHAVWISPLTDPLYMLSVALTWGIGFLVLVSLINILNHLTLGDYRGALFAPNGLLSLLFYTGLLGMGYGFYLKVDTGPVWSLLAILTLGSLFAYKLISEQAALTERIMVALIETFETIIGYISNTLSFLRVAAFSLNHVALAIAVFTLANSMGEAGHWLMILFGNLFIMILEGAIVTIQVLRLEYYEGFTRFFAGDGKVFRPLKL
ncbi:MAG: V-type ATPase 116kDa subunit family protein [Gammaproteobacteria bacterium]|nr:V-type ATPase 116kDa subunit family protein [Gammaproteobacteria bacterium]